jgi:hypothetical protein
MKVFYVLILFVFDSYVLLPSCNESDADVVQNYDPIVLETPTPPVQEAVYDETVCLYIA